MSPLDVFPSANPFPVLGTFTISGERRVRQKVRSIPRLPVRRLVDEVESYRREFVPIWNNLGHAVLLRGEHGSGKTHTIYAAVEGIELVEGQASANVFTLYTLQQDDNFFDCYRQIVARVNKEPGLWKKLAQSLLATMTAEQWSQDLGRSNPDQEVLAALREDPEKVVRTLETYTVSRSGAVSRQEKALLDLTSSAFNKNLKAAIDALQGDRFDQVATRWLSLEPISVEEQEAIGVPGPIDNPDDALAAILLLSALLINGGFKLVLVVDQFEKLLVGTEPLIKRRNEGYLRRLIEGTRIRNALLILSGSDDGWNSLPEDIKSRIGQQHVIECPILSLDEALDLIRIYLTPGDAKFVRGTGGIHPLTLPAVKEMLTLSFGNPRKLLQFSHEAMRQAIASQTVVDEVLIRQIAQSNAGQYFDSKSVLAETRRVLTFQPLRVEQEFTLDGTRFDFAVLYEDGSAALLVEISEAIFQDDEAHNAYRTASAMSRLRQTGVRAPVVLIVTGYVSPEVLEKVSAVVQKLIVYSPATFEKELRPILDSVQHNAPLIEAQANREVVGKIEGLLRSLAEQRAQQNVVIENRTTELLDAQAKSQERHEAVRREWSNLRRDLIDKIRTARQLRSAEAVREINRQITLARNFWVARDSILVAFAIFVFAFTEFRSSDHYYSYQMMAYLTLSLVALDAFMALLIPGAWTGVQSGEDLTRFGGNLLAATYGLIHAINPIVRLSGYLTMFGRSRIPRERLGMIRQAACKNVKGPLSQKFWDIPEALMLFQRKVPIDGKPSGEIARAVDLLTWLQADESDKKTSSFVGELVFQVGQRKGPWYDLLDLGLDAWKPDRIPWVSERSIREAVRFLSPFEKGGLGTYDFLDSIETIDDLFLFCSQTLFYFEQGVFSSPQSPPQKHVSNRSSAPPSA